MLKEPVNSQKKLRSTQLVEVELKKIMDSRVDLHHFVYNVSPTLDQRILILKEYYTLKVRKLSKSTQGLY